MSLEDFKKKYLGKQVEYHSYSKNAYYQCTDAANQYIVEVLKLTPVIGTDAKDFPEKINTEEFDFVKNTPDGIPPVGSIIIWNGRVGGGAGHIAIVLNANVNQFTSFDQNWSKPLYCTEETHTYSNVRGWLIPKSDIIGDMPKWLEELLKLDIKLDISASEGEIRGRVSEIKHAVEKYGEQEKRIAKLEKDLAFQSGEAAKFEEELRISRENRINLEKEIEELRKQNTRRDEKITSLEASLEALQEQLDPNAVVVVKKEEYERLIARRTLDKYTVKQLVLEVFKRTWQKK